MIMISMAGVIGKHRTEQDTMTVLLPRLIHHALQVGGPIRGRQRENSHWRIPEVLRRQAGRVLTLARPSVPDGRGT